MDINELASMLSEYDAVRHGMTSEAFRKGDGRSVWIFR